MVFTMQNVLAYNISLVNCKSHDYFLFDTTQGLIRKVFILLGND